MFIILINSRVNLWTKQATFPSRGLERWLHVFHLRPLYPKPQNDVLYILVREWFRELHKHCVEARGQRVLHTLARCTDSVSTECAWSRPGSGRCLQQEVTPRTCTVTPCVSCMSVYTLRFYAFARRILKGPANEIPRARIRTHIPRPSIRERFQFSRARINVILRMSYVT